MSIAHTSVIPLENATIIQTPSVGGVDSGITFNDLVKLDGTPGYTINPDWPIRQITVRYGVVIDGLSILYSKAGSHGGAFLQDHGTTVPSVLNVREIEIAKDDIIIAVTGKHGETPNTLWGPRVTQLSIVVYHSGAGQDEGKVQVYGPYGDGASGTPFKFTTLGGFIAMAGTAKNSEKNIGADPGVGLFSLALLDASEIRKA